MNVVDSSAWIAYFRGESNAERFASPIEDLQQLVVPSIAMTEVFKFLGRHLGEKSALEAVAHMERGLVVPLDASLSLKAAEVGLQWGLPLADSIIYATARRYDAALWTQDADFRDLPGVRFFM